MVFVEKGRKSKNKMENKIALKDQTSIECTYMYTIILVVVYFSFVGISRH